MKSHNPFVATSLFVLLSLAAVSAQAPTVKVSKFRNIKAPGAVETDTYAVNSFGVVAGDYVDSSDVQHGMILNGKSLTAVDRTNCQTAPGLGAIAFFGINNTEGSQGPVVGWCFDTSQSTDVAFIYSSGGFTDITPPGSIATIAEGINDKGQVSGAYLDESDVQHGFFFDGKAYTTLDVPNHTAPNAWSINNKAQIAIFAIDKKSHYDSFIYSAGKFQNVNFKKAPDSIIQTINNTGDRIYTVTDAQGVFHGVFFLSGKGGGFKEFDDPRKGVANTYASGLSDKLEIIGDYTTSTKGPSSPSMQGYSALGCCRGLLPGTVSTRR